MSLLTRKMNCENARNFIFLSGENALAIRCRVTSCVDLLFNTFMKVCQYSKCIIKGKNKNKKMKENKITKKQIIENKIKLKTKKKDTKR